MLIFRYISRSVKKAAQLQKPAMLKINILLRHSKRVLWSVESKNILFDHFLTRNEKEMDDK